MKRQTFHLVLAFLVFAVSVPLAAFFVIPEPAYAASISSVTSGNWSNSAIWSSGTAPGPNDSVTISGGHTVTYDLASSRVAGVTVNAGGTLVFAPSQSVTLETDKNVLVFGLLQMRPSSAAVNHKLRFVNVDETKFVGGGMAVLASDVGLWVRGNGVLDFAGASKTSWTRLTGSASAGASVISVQDTTGWRAGDEIVVVPTERRSVGARSYQGFEERIVQNTSGNTVTLSAPLSHNHPRAINPFNGDVYTAEVLNLTRNVVITGTGTGSADPAENGRAHIQVISSQPQQLKYFEARLLGPRFYDAGDTEGVLGRYPLHFHRGGEGSRGTLIEGVVVRQGGSHAFVPHGTHGITMKDTIAYDIWEEAYWWDPPAGDSTNNTNDLMIDRAVAAFVSEDPPFRGFSLDGFTLGAGVGNVIQNSVAVGVGNSSANGGGFGWPSKANHHPNVWGFSNNIGHNNKGAGIAVWQNDANNHVVKNFVGYRNKQGISHGAYRNPYQYFDTDLFENDNEGLIQHALPKSNISFRTDGYSMAFVRFRSEQPLKIVKHSLSSNLPILYQDCSFPRVIVAEKVHPGRYDFVHCNLQPTDFDLQSQLSGSRIRVQNQGGSVFQIDDQGQVSTIASFYDTSGSDTGDGGGDTMPVVSFTANPLSIVEGGSSTLSWSSSNATSCSIFGGDVNNDGDDDNLVVDGATAGSIIVSPLEPTTYEVVCSNATQSELESVTIDVTLAQPAASLSASDTSIDPGQSVTLSWTSTNADSCTGNRFDTGGALSGSVLVKPAQTATYILTCVNGGFSSNQLGLTDESSVIVTVATQSDTAPPLRSGGAPTGTLPAGTVETTVSLTTDETATCKYSTTTGTSFAEMVTTFSATAGTSHSTRITNLRGGRSYSYHIRCQDQAGNANATDFTVSFSIEAADTTAPTVSNIQATNITTSGATITWTTNEASNTQVEYGQTTAYGQSSPLSASLVTSHSVTLSSLSAGTTYNFKVKSRDAAGNLAQSLNSTFTTTAAPDTVPPGAIGNLETSNVKTTSFTLSWTAPADPPPNSGVASYDLRYSTSQITSANWSTALQASGEPVPATPGTNQNYILGGLNSGTTYHVAIRSVDAAGNLSDLSNTVSATTVAVDATPPAISSVQTSNITLSGATITWATNEASDTQVEYGLTSSHGSATTLNTSLVADHSADLSGLTAGTLYHYRVKSRDAAGNQAVSSDRTFITAAPADTTVPTISNIQAVSDTSGSATITWTTDEASDTQVEFGATSSYGSLSTLNTKPVTSHNVTLAGLALDTTYHYRVKSRDAAGNQAVSPDQTFITPASAPTNNPPTISGILVTNIQSDSATIIWTTDEGATSHVEYGPTAAYGDSSTPSSTLKTAHSVTLTGLNRKTTYHFRVKSTDGQGTLSASQDTSFTTHARLPKPPKVRDLQATSGSAVLTWVNPTDYEFFQGVVILKRTDTFALSFDPAAKVQDTSSSSWTDNSVSQGNTYYYTVLTYDDLGVYSDPEIVSLTIEASVIGDEDADAGPSVVAPAVPPTNLKAFGGPNQIILTWDYPESTSTIRVKVIRKENTAPISALDGTVLFEGQSNEFVDTTVVPGRTYHYAVFGLNRRLNPSALLTVSARLGDKTAEQIVSERATDELNSRMKPVAPGSRGGTALIKYPDSPTVYVLEDGVSRAIPSLAVLRHNFGQRPIAVIDRSETYTNQGVVKFEPGALLKTPTNRTVYLILDDGSLYGFVSYAEFTRFGYRDGLIFVVAENELNQYPRSAITKLSYHGHGNFVKYAHNPTVYRIEHNRKRAVSSPALFFAYAYSWDQVLTIPDDITYADEAPLTFPDGVLIKGSTDTVYLIESGVKRPFTSAEEFHRLGFSFDQIRQVSDSELSLHQGGQVLGYSARYHERY